MKISLYPILVFIILINIFSTSLFAHGMSDAEIQTILNGGNKEYILIGANHMLLGYDHLLFVFGIVFFLSSIKQIVKYITVFTLGHSITLIFATFNAIKINYFLIDAVIGLSICYIAFVNLYNYQKKIKFKSTNMLIIIFVFGLIHGFGLSTRLQQLPLNMDTLLVNILSFNIGIEIGQLFALVIMLIMLTLFKKSRYFGSFSFSSNIVLFIAGIFLFSVQLFDYKKNIVIKKHEQNIVYKDTINIKIPANSGKEYKLWIKKDKELQYTWKTNGEVLYSDFHGEPAGETSGYFKSYKESTNHTMVGSVKVPFLGTHGWYWKNESSKTINVKLKIKGEYKRFGL